jgi:hypothetical protein
MAKASTHNTRTCTALKKKNDTAADELQMQVTIEKKKQNLKKKQWADDK